MVLPALARGGYAVKRGVHVGTRPGGGKHIVDVLAKDGRGRTFLISLKWQQVSGTAEQKIPFEVISLAEAIRDARGEFEKAYIVLGGIGWTLRDFYIAGGLNDHLIFADLVRLVTLEQFVALANTGSL